MRATDEVTQACPIERVEALVLRAKEDSSDLDAAQETVVVRLTDAAGRTGIGEADSVEEAVAEVVHRRGGHAWSSALDDVLIGRDPFQTEAIWADLAQATRWSGWSGIAMHAIAAVDVAVHDLASKQLGRPAFHLLGGARRDRLRPYATCWVSRVGAPDLPTVLDATLDQMRQAVDLGFGAVKMELLFEDLATDRDLVTCIQEGRRAVGDDVDLLVDFGYRWTHWRDAHQVLRKVEPQDIYLAEAPLQPDDLIGHARLGERVDTRVGGAETASSLDECRAWLEVGRVDVLQPDVGRAGGLSHMRRICELAALYGASVIPHCWRTGINAAAARHLHAALPNVPMVEFLPPQFSTSPLRHALVGDEPVVVDGFLELPSSPGLGVHLDLDTIERFVVRRGHGPVPADERGHRR